MYMTYGFIVVHSSRPPPYWTTWAGSYDTHILLRSILQNTNEGGHRLPQILNDHRLRLRLRSLSDP